MNDNHLIEPRSEKLLKEVLSIFNLGDHEAAEVCRLKKVTRDLNNDK